MAKKVNVKRTENSQWLEVKLTEEEIKKEAKELADAINKQREAEDRLDSIKAQIKGEVTELEGKIKKCATLVNQGKEHRPVPVETIFDYEKDSRTDTRLDTGEVISSRALTKDEKQMELQV